MDFIRITSKKDLENLLIEYSEKEELHKNLYIKDMSILDLSDIEILSTKITIDNVFIPIDENELGNIRLNLYTLEEYKKLKIKVDSIISQIDKNKTDINKFVEIYRKLGESLKYAGEDLDWKNRTFAQIKEHNSLRGLLTGRCVCAGYSLILRQVLACANIESKYITNNPKNKDEHPGHAWTQVKIDGRWYNCDLSRDWEDIEKSNIPELCLKSNDDPYYQALGEQSNGESCNNSYSKKEIEEYMFPEKVLRRKIKWFFKNQGELEAEFLENECAKIGIDFNEELMKAKQQAEIEEEFLIYTTYVSKGYSTTKFPSQEIKKELIEKCKKAGLLFAKQRIMSENIVTFRNEILNYEKKDIEDKCYELGLNPEYEMENAKMLPIAADPKNCVKNIGTGELARDIRAGSSEIKNNYNELEIPKQTKNIRTQ